VRELVGGMKPSVANQVIAALSAVFSWAVKQDIVVNHPTKGVDRHELQDRARILSDSEIAQFWNAFDDAGLVKSCALKTILLTGQRPGEVSAMRFEHIKDNAWWELPGKPDAALGWGGTKNGEPHRVPLSQPVLDVIAEMHDGMPKQGFVFANERGSAVIELPAAMRRICQKLACERATPHDLRRSFGSRVTELGHGRQAMDRLLNHADNTVGSVYDRFNYAAVDRKIVEHVGGHIMRLARGETGDGKVIAAKFGNV
jgi:integrase